MITYRHTFRVRAPLDAVNDFHRRSANLGAITPPPAIVKLHHAPEVLGEGDEMAFTIWFGQLPVRWTSGFEQVTPRGFVDTQVRGPFRSWTHRHTFVPLDDHTTEIRDEVTVVFRLHPLHFPIALGMWLSLPVLFAYRTWKTRRLLDGGAW